MTTPFVIRTETNGREQNEDSVLALRLLPGLDQPPIFVLAIADGMGGHPHGEKISREALKRLSVLLFEQLSVYPHLNQASSLEAVADTHITNLLWSAMEETNSYLRRIITVNHWGLAGSTIVVALLFKDKVFVGNLGDSPLYHYQHDDRNLRKVTEDHTVAGVLLRNKLISPEMARAHEGRSRLEYFFGREILPSEPPIHQFNLVAGDKLLICSDGVNGKLDESTINTILANDTATLEQQAEQLLAAAREKGETDNQTLILWQHRTLGSPEVTRLLPENSNQEPSSLLKTIKFDESNEANDRVEEHYE